MVNDSVKNNAWLGRLIPKKARAKIPTPSKAIEKLNFSKDVNVILCGFEIAKLEYFECIVIMQFEG